MSAVVPGARLAEWMDHCVGLDPQDVCAVLEIDAAQLRGLIDGTVDMDLGLAQRLEALTGILSSSWLSWEALHQHEISRRPRRPRRAPASAPEELQVPADTRDLLTPLVEDFAWVGPQLLPGTGPDHLLTLGLAVLTDAGVPVLIDSATALVPAAEGPGGVYLHAESLDYQLMLRHSHARLHQVAVSIRRIEHHQVLAMIQAMVVRSGTDRAQLDAIEQAGQLTGDQRRLLRRIRGMEFLAGV